MNIFEQASINKLRFSTNKGDLTTEQLWDLPLTSKTSFDLDTIAKSVNDELRGATEESFVATSTNPAKPSLELKLEILKHIIAIKLAQNDARRLAAQRAEERRKLLDILSKKEDAALESLKPEELRARLAALDS
ncbi:hypothetical protein [Rhodoferax fermentans]|uniref:Uncharacterized protein n=1 Tax=Rhodoferax fermentans TaxID=28066 RepID=A0A1T1APD4_RHOFE|nr:hypothetical protein [Rhodoferax fermentans]OOV05788.1 hypothetical protein RF819_02850 [Rhodoferax fermentans]